jgi:hypothetical protein
MGHKWLFECLHQPARITITTSSQSEELIMLTITQHHRGIIGHATWDFDIQRYHGMIEGISDQIVYGGGTIDELQDTFQEAVDVYLKQARCYQESTLLN